MAQYSGVVLGSSLVTAERLRDAMGLDDWVASTARILRNGGLRGAVIGNRVLLDAGVVLSNDTAVQLRSLIAFQRGNGDMQVWGLR